MVVVDMVREETVTETIKAVDRISRVGESAKRFPTRAANQTKREETICEGRVGKKNPQTWQGPIWLERLLESEWRLWS
jgi:hypothetical protein